MEVILTFLEKYGVLACFIIITLEYACFPISSEIVLPLAGFISKRNDVPFYYIYLVSSLGGLLGSSTCYLIGFLGGRTVINKIINRFPKSRQGFEKSISRFQKKAFSACMFMRLIPLCRTYISFVAGVYRYRFLSFIFSSSLGIFIWNLLFVGIGYYSYDRIDELKGYYQAYEVYIVVFILLLLFLVNLKNGFKEKHLY